MRRKARPRPIDVPLLLKRLSIDARREAPTKLVAFCPHPAHDNKRTPAWFIRDKPGDPYHSTHGCASCGFSGGAAALVRAVLGLTQEESHAYLAELRGAPQVPVRVEALLTQRRAREGCSMPKAAREVEPGDAAAAYLFGRGVFHEQYAAHRIYWVPQDAREDGKPHRLRNRVLLPYRDRDGVLGSYAARTMGDDRKRYLAPSRDDGGRQDAVFGEELWGEERRVVVLCEGAFNALAAERAFGLPGHLKVAALAGSQPEPSQLLKLAAFARVVVATDNDPAGNKAWEAIREHLEGTVELRRACPPEGEDLDSMKSEDVVGLLEPHVRGMVGCEQR